MTEEKDTMRKTYPVHAKRQPVRVVKPPRLTYKAYKRILNICIFSMVVLSLMLSYIVVRYVWASRYEVDVYDCVDMSIDCHNFFKSIGIESHYMNGARTPPGGNLDDIQGHAWLNVNLPLIGWQQFQATELAFYNVAKDEGWKVFNESEFPIDRFQVWGPYWDNATIARYSNG